jgi:hypothetical protein
LRYTPENRTLVLRCEFAVFARASHHDMTTADRGLVDDWQESSQRVIEAAQLLGRAVKPVLRVKEGSGGRKLCGSAFVIEHAGEFAAVTAAHVLEDDPGPRYLAVSERGSAKWPSPYSRIVAIATDAPDPDIACSRFALAPDAEPGAADAFPLISVQTGFIPTSGMTFLAVGHPFSRGKMRHATGTLHASLVHISGEAVTLPEYAKLGLDRRVHLAMRYESTAVRLLDGSAGKGPVPEGMSGGVLLLMTQDDARVVHLLPVGIVTTYRPGPPGLLVATRLDALLDFLAPRRPLELREFARAV